MDLKSVLLTMALENSLPWPNEEVISFLISAAPITSKWKHIELPTISNKAQNDQGSLDDGPNYGRSEIPYGAFN